MSFYATYAIISKPLTQFLS